MKIKNSLFIIIVIVLLTSCVKSKFVRQMDNVKQDVNKLELQTHIIKDNVKNLSKKVDKVKQDVKNLGKCELKDIENIKLDIEILQNEFEILDNKLFQLKESNLYLETEFHVEHQKYKYNVNIFRIYVFVSIVVLIILIKKDVF